MQHNDKEHNPNLLLISITGNVSSTQSINLELPNSSMLRGSSTVI